METKSKCDKDDSDLEDFLPSTMHLHTPGKRKCLSIDSPESGDFTSTSPEICEFLTNISAQKHYKKIKINLELVHSE